MEEQVLTMTVSLNPRTPQAIHLATTNLKTLSAGISRGHPRSCRTTCSQTFAFGNLHRPLSRMTLHS
jgi:hypothetical protein